MEASQERLDLKLYEENDDEEDLLYKRKLYALVNGDVTPAAAAADFDAWIVGDSNKRLNEFKNRPDQNNLTAAEESRGIVSLRAVGPNPSGNIELVFWSLAKLCAAFSPYHTGQNNIIQFLEALRALPEHVVPEIVEQDGPIDELKLWPFGGNWLGLAETFRREGDGKCF